MACAAGLALLHIFHGCPTLAAAIRECLGVAVTALVCSGMEVVAEIADGGSTAVFEGQVSRFIANVTLVAVSC